MFDHKFIFQGVDKLLLIVFEHLFRTKKNQTSKRWLDVFIFWSSFFLFLTIQRSFLILVIFIKNSLLYGGGGGGEWKKP